MLFQGSRDLKSGCSFFDDKHRNVAITSCFTGLGSNEEDIAVYTIGDEHL